MDRDWASPWDVRDRDRDQSAGVLLPSRSAAVEALMPGLRAQAGPVLLTGDAGVGKTWLGRRLEAAAPPEWRWLSIDLSPAISVAELYRLIGHGLGLPAAGGAASSRVELAGSLRECAADGSSWVLAIDEAHGVGDDVLEELRVLSNQIGRPDGFAGMILIGQTALARRLTSRALMPLASRIAARVHLRPLDIEEARSLVASVAPGLALGRERLAALHRDTGGNPRRLLQLSRMQAGTAPRVAPEPKVVPEPARVPIPAPAVPAVVAAAPAVAAPARRWDAPVLGEAKPPIRDEDGLIEVGWAPEAADAADEPAGPPPPAATVEESPLESEESITDHYAALQAWNEWALNQGRGATAAAEGATATPAAAENEVAQEVSSGLPAGSPDVWLEGQQEFAPYSQLFSRVRQRRETN